LLKLFSFYGMVVPPRRSAERPAELNERLNYMLLDIKVNGKGPLSRKLEVDF